MAYQVQLDFFEGPLPLLFHLLEENRLDINEVSLTRITQQYLDHLETMQEMDLEVASEFLIMAAQLMEMKTRALLPKHKKKRSAPSSETDLLQRLQWYGKVRKAVLVLKEMEEERQSLFHRNRDSLIGALDHLEEGWQEKKNPLQGITLEQLARAYSQAAQKENKDTSSARDQKKEYLLQESTCTVEDQMEAILECCVSNPRGFPFSMLVETTISTEEQVVSFLALLELSRLKQIRLQQKNPFQDILVQRGEAWRGAGE